MRDRKTYLVDTVKYCDEVLENSLKNKGKINYRIIPYQMANVYVMFNVRIQMQYNYIYMRMYQN